jgi:glutamate N-acetyltransferase / amino-acid N-acetyltransferase
VSVTAPKGFIAGGIACGIKDGAIPDLALVASASGPVPAAATFTTNLAAAAPVQLSRRHLAATKGYAAGIVLNSGCANAATGASGLEAAQRSAAAVGTALGVGEEEILVCSTGLIGIPLQVERLLAGVAPLLAACSDDGGAAAARAIMTTDTHPKQVRVAGNGIVVGGMAKGAGMIAPNMATMLSVLTTDADVTPELLHHALRAAVAVSFNELIVDGATSTNDTVIALASRVGAAVGPDVLVDALTEACGELAEQMASDAEGTTRVAIIRVVGAASAADARAAARKVASSLLVKTSLFGADPYWGRIVSELGSSGAAFQLDRVAVAYGGVAVCAGGEAIEHDRAALAAAMQGARVEIQCDLGLGNGEAMVRTTDLGHGYIDENMRTS